jgi:hypothetical protein
VSDVAKVFKVIEITNLRSLFPPYGSEAEAIQAFSEREWNRDDQPETRKTRVVCVDPSEDLLAVLYALLSRAGYYVFTTRYIGDAAVLAKANRPSVLICGPGMIAVPTVPGTIEKLRQNSADTRVLQLPSDFRTAEAGQASQELLSQLSALVASL